MFNSNNSKNYDGTPRIAWLGSGNCNQKPVISTPSTTSNIFSLFSSSIIGYLNLLNSNQITNYVDNMNTKINLPENLAFDPMNGVTNFYDNGNPSSIGLSSVTGNFSISYQFKLTSSRFSFTPTPPPSNPTMVMQSISMPYTLLGLAQSTPSAPLMIQFDSITNSIMSMSGGTQTSPPTTIKSNNITAPVLNTWYNLTITFSAPNNTYSIYMNGALLSSFSYSFNSAYIFFGPIPAYVRNLMIFNTCLQQSDISTLTNYWQTNVGPTYSIPSGNMNTQSNIVPSLNQYWSPSRTPSYTPSVQTCACDSIVIGTCLTPGYSNNQADVDAWNTIFKSNNWKNSDGTPRVAWLGSGNCSQKPVVSTPSTTSNWAPSLSQYWSPSPVPSRTPSTTSNIFLSLPLSLTSSIFSYLPLTNQTQTLNYFDTNARNSLSNLKFSYDSITGVQSTSMYPLQFSFSGSNLPFIKSGLSGDFSIFYEFNATTNNPSSITLLNPANISTSIYINPNFSYNISVTDANFTKDIPFTQVRNIFINLNTWNNIAIVSISFKIYVYMNNALWFTIQPSTTGIFTDLQISGIMGNMRNLMMFNKGLSKSEVNLLNQYWSTNIPGPTMSIPPVNITPSK